MDGIAILDDNRLHLNKANGIVTNYIQKNHLETKIYLFSDSQSLLTAIQKQNSIDIVLLDIELEEELGIDIAKKINEINKTIQIVFLTSHLHYATDIFETQHCYFVLKEDFEKRLPDIMNKAHSALSNGKLYVKQKGKEILLNENDIYYLERSLRTTKIYMEQGEVSLSEKISELIKQLNPEKFVRCHTSYIVNLSYVKEYRRQDIVLVHDITIPISRTFQAEVKRRFMQWAKRQL